MNRPLPLGLLALIALGCGSSSPDPAAGKVAPDFTVSRVGTDEKEKVKLSDLKGKVVLIDFWATWCGPCKQIAPTIEEMYERHNSKGLEVLAISDESETELIQFEKQDKPPYPLYRDYAGLGYAMFGVSGIPRTILVDREGKIITDITGADPGAIADAVNKAMG